jgi:hypothetical protein
VLANFAKRGKHEKEQSQSNAALLSNACIPSSVAFSVYDSKVILSGFKALHTSE